MYIANNRVYAERLKRKWINFPGTLREANEHAEELLSNWAKPRGSTAAQLGLNHGGQQAHIERKASVDR